ncbi:cation-translocating P-type ATPase [Archaeoglobus veneficus]|uniref:ATPase, P-type (Transporting), HAD superfamily, subfamily IC n=1 Tax=Archaeoglobus veneficus (strain DSM 11195 / SNP6) TaxID=693661 RepID=F2KNB6_ARCVS|nr:HAD-IC family P-type ATPase [Archaeoglobus veneficus]AEA47318.1 ATPase, P-type (transporting), HAD superfamily, subfamily IC [Archaeoglobus veneficus SNP6]
MGDWHTFSHEEVFETFETSPQGLKEEEARKRLEVFGPNEIREKKENELVRFLLHFHDPLIYVLIVSGILTVYLGKLADSVIIFAVVAVNAIIGYAQERKAEKTLEALKRIVEVRARVIRGGLEKEIPARLLVPGDVIVLEAGMKVPADARLFEANGLRVDESLLTGESVPVEKSVDAVEERFTRPNMVFAGTLVTEGYARAVVVATSGQTELGKIARRTEREKRIETPLLRRMKKLGRNIFFIIIALSAFNFLIGLYRGYETEMTFLASVGLAVAAIPESLPALLTMILALGVRDMAARKAIVRRLPAVETLGSVTTICTDKTGTLTQNRIKVVRIYAGGKEYEIEELKSERVRELREVKLTILAGYVCNRAVYRADEGGYVVSGDPTEIALLEAAAIADESLEKEKRIIGEIPFDPAIRFMATAIEDNGLAIVYAKGSPERIISMCSEMMVNGEPVEIDVEELHSAAENLASRGMRILAFAYKVTDVEGFSIREHLRDMVFLGFQCMIDPPREECYEAVKNCRHAGVRVVMITGDHPATALAIARELGIRGYALTGDELDRMSDEELRKALKDVGIFARVLPEHKFRIVRAFQESGEIVAVTGDGVNDAPALKAADIGVAMGSGTEVAKEASDMIILDDNFATIVAAIEEGRNVFRKIQKVLAWLLPTNGGEALSVMSAFLIGIALPILPVQILWINTVTAILLGTTLVFEPREPGLLRLKPTGKELLSRQILFRITWISILMVLGAYLLYFSQSDGDAARTAAMNTIVFFEIFYLLSSRSLSESFFTTLKRWNPAIIPGIAAMAGLQVAATHLPDIFGWLHTAPLTSETWLKIVAVTSLVFFLAEIEKFATRQKF